MKTNQEIANLLKANREMTKFASHIKISTQALYYRLDSNRPKDNLYGQYIDFLVKQKGKK